MFRDEKNLYITSSGYGGMHDITISRQKKKNELIRDYKDKIFTFKTAINRLEFVLNKHVDDKDFDKKYYSAKLNRHKATLRKLENELRELESIENYNHKKIKTSIKKRKNQWVKAEILKIIKEAKSKNINTLSKEDVAIRLKVREYQVEQVFMELNKEGILSQAKHKALHDTNRDPGGYDDWYGWASDIYYIK